MIRDPSDGSVRPKPTSATNWGLKSLDEPKRKPKPAPTREELEAHYRKYNLAFQPKSEDQP